MLPYAIYPSPQTQKTVLSILSKYLLEYAIPQATDKPWPKDPVAISTNGIFGTGCPSIKESFNLKDINWSSVNTPALYKAAYKIGAAWPFESTSLSFKKLLVFLASNFNPA